MTFCVEHTLTPFHPWNTGSTFLRYFIYLFILFVYFINKLCIVRTTNAGDSASPFFSTFSLPFLYFFPLSLFFFFRSILQFYQLCWWRTNQDVQPFTWGLWWAKGWEEAPITFPQVWHCSPVLRLLLPIKTTLQRVMTTPVDYYLFWNLKSDHCGVRYARW